MIIYLFYILVYLVVFHFFFFLSLHKTEQFWASGVQASTQ